MNNASGIWYAEDKRVICPTCGEEMFMHGDEETFDIFFACPSCTRELSIAEAEKNLEE